jgi:hypothetical protein
MKKNKYDKEAGLVRYPILLDVALFFVVALTVYAAFQSQKASNRSDDATSKVADSAIVNCQNANETRQANQELWNFIIELSVASPGNKESPAAIRYLHEIQRWVDKIYQLHDCHDLTKKYVIPPPPKILTVFPTPSPTKSH